MLWDRVVEGWALRGRNGGVGWSLHFGRLLAVGVSWACAQACREVYGIEVFSVWIDM